MFPALLSERIDNLIDDLIREGGMDGSSLASILLVARDAGRRDDLLLALSHRLRAAHDELAGAAAGTGPDD